MDFSTAMSSLSSMQFLEMLFLAAPVDWLIVYAFQVVASLCILMTAVAMLMWFSQVPPRQPGYPHEFGCTGAGFGLVLGLLSVWDGAPDRMVWCVFALAMSGAVMKWLLSQVKERRAKAATK